MTAYGDRQRERERKRAEALAKPGEPIVYKIGEDTVTLTKQPMEYDYPAEPGKRSTDIGPKFKSKYRVELNGVHRGWLVARNGWGAGWTLHKLDKGDRNPPYWRQHGAKNIEPGHGDKLKPDQIREAFARAVPTLVKEGRLGTLEEQDEAARVEEARKAQEAIETKTKQAQWRRERIEAYTTERDHYTDRIETLKTLIERQVLSNYESEIIAQVITEAEAQVAEYQRRLNSENEAAARAAKEDA